MRTRRSPSTTWATLAAAWVAYTGMLAVLQFWVYPALTAPWQRPAVGLVAVVLVALACFLLFPEVVADFRAPPWHWIVGALLVVAGAVFFTLVTGLGWAMAGLQVAKYIGVGLGEETLFRGVMWRQLEFLLPGKAWVLVLSSALFGLSHLPGVLAPQGALWPLGTLSLVGVLFGLVGLRLGKLPAVAGLHTAWDLFQP